MPDGKESRSHLWVAATAALACGLQFTGEAHAVAILGSFGAALILTLVLVFTPRSHCPRGVVTTGLVTAACLLAPASSFSDVLPVLLLATSIQLAAAISMPRRGAFLVVVVTAVAIVVGRGFDEGLNSEDLMVGIVTFGVGFSLNQVVAIAYQAARSKRSELLSKQEQKTKLMGPTRIELNRVKHELSVMASMLRNEENSRQSIEEQLFEAYQVKEAFLATMSHELRTPLHQIIGYSELLIEEAEESSDPTELIGDVTRIQKAAMNLHELIQNVLDQSQIESGTLKTVPEELVLHPFVDGLIGSFISHAQSRQNTLRLRCSEDIGMIVTDARKLQTVLRNLLSNACKFTENGTIRLAVEFAATPRPSYVFTVSDTGVGIAPDDIARLLQPFEQLDNSRTRRFDGAGLGLAICRHFTSLLGGELCVESTLGIGTSVSFRLPQKWADPEESTIFLSAVAERHAS